MPLSSKKRVILEKFETTYATDATPAAADALLVRGEPTINFIAGSYVSRDLMTGNEGAQPDIHTNRHGMVETQVEASASGVVGTAPAYAPMLLACGFAETVTAATSVEYTLVSAGYGSSTIVAAIGGADGHKGTLLGCRGSLSFTAERGAIPYFTSQRMGRYSAPADASTPARDFSGFKTPHVMEPSAMNVFTLGGDTLCLRSFSFTDGRTPVIDKFANCEDVDISLRNITGSMVVEFPKLATKNMLVESLTASLQALVWEIGKTAGTKLRISGPKVQAKFTGYQNIDNTLAGAFDLIFTPTDAGDDELVLTYV